MTITDSEQSAPADWEIAGSAWGHAAHDWAYRFEPYARDAIEDVFAATGVAQDTRLLDVACGSGYALGRAERRGAVAAGLDASRELIALAEQRATTAQLVPGTMFDLPWDGESFDVVTSFNGVWGGCQAAVEEMFRVTVPGGRVGITFWGPGDALDLRGYFFVVGTTAPGAAEELIELAAIGAPGVAESMLSTAGYEDVERRSSYAILELIDADDAWRCLRSPGVVLPSLQHTGEEEVRTQVLAAIEPYRTPQGGYRLINQLDYVVGTKP